MLTPRSRKTYPAYKRTIINHLLIEQREVFVLTETPFSTPGVSNLKEFSKMYLNDGYQKETLLNYI